MKERNPDWKKLLGDGTKCPLCHGLLEDCFGEIKYKKCKQCGFTFELYFILTKKWPETKPKDEMNYIEKVSRLNELGLDEWDFQGRVDQHLEKLKTQVKDGEEAKKKLGFIKIKL